MRGCPLACTRSTQRKSRGVPDILPLLLPVCGLCYGPSMLGPRRLLRRPPLPCIVPRRLWFLHFDRYPPGFLFLRATGSQVRYKPKSPVRAGRQITTAVEAGRQIPRLQPLQDVDVLVCSRPALLAERLPKTQGKSNRALTPRGAMAWAHAKKVKRYPNAAMHIAKVGAYSARPGRPPETPPPLLGAGCPPRRFPTSGSPNRVHM